MDLLLLILLSFNFSLNKSKCWLKVFIKKEAENILINYLQSRFFLKKIYQYNLVLLYYLI